jgi:pyruvate carboxylase
LKTGASVIPIDPASSIDEVVNFAKAGVAAAIVLSPKLANENPELTERLKKEKLEYRFGL